MEQNSGSVDFRLVPTLFFYFLFVIYSLMIYQGVMVAILSTLLPASKKAHRQCWLWFADANCRTGDRQRWFWWLRISNARARAMQRPLRFTTNAAGALFQIHGSVSFPLFGALFKLVLHLSSGIRKVIRALNSNGHEIIPELKSLVCQEQTVKQNPEPQFEFIECRFFCSKFSKSMFAKIAGLTLFMVVLISCMTNHFLKYY